jgi:ABC-type branched-subunit amino acid transport system permease subunit
MPQDPHGTTIYRGAGAVQLLPDRFPHHVRQGLALGKLAQGFVHQGLIVAARHLGADLENGQCGIVYTHGDAGFPAVGGYVSLNQFM